MLALPVLWYSLVATAKLRIAVGEWGDTAYLGNMYEVEGSGAEAFRWSRGNADIVLPNLSGGDQILRVWLHAWRPPEHSPPVVRVELNGRPWLQFLPGRDMRPYDFVLPSDALHLSRRLTFSSDVFSSPTDSREVGIAIGRFELLASGSSTLPNPLQFGSQALLLGLGLVLTAALRLPRRVMIACGVILAGALLAANLYEPLWISQIVSGWLAIVGLLLLATWLLRPAFARWMSPWLNAFQVDAAWALLVGAFGLRLLGAVHPLFDIHDLGFHTFWLQDIIRGQIYIYSTPSEFQNRAIFNPPIGYLLMAPFHLFLPALRLPIQVATGLVDGVGCLLVLLLARELGLSARAALLALALYVALPINTTMLWWGFVTNDMAQTAGLLLFFALLRLVRRPSRWAWALFIFAVLLCLLMHIGAVVLSMGLLGGTVLLGWFRIAPRLRWQIVGATALVVAVVGLLYVSGAFNSGFAQPSDETAAAQAEESTGQHNTAIGNKLWLVQRAVSFGYLPLVAALVPLGYVSLLRRNPQLDAPRPLNRHLIVAWLLICLGFFGVYLGLGLLVRYLYFIAPLAALAAGAILAQLWSRRGQLVVTTIVLMVVWSGVALWIGGVLLRIKPSLVPLVQ